jgi:hypothetical protein
VNVNKIPAVLNVHSLIDTVKSPSGPFVKHKSNEHCGMGVPKFETLVPTNQRQNRFMLLSYYPITVGDMRGKLDYA